MSKIASKLHKNYLSLQILVFSCWAFIIIGAIIFQMTQQLGAIAIIIISYVAAFAIVLYVEIYFFQNKRKWWKEAFYIVLIWLPFVIESIIHHMHGKKTDKMTKQIISIINDEELPFFFLFGSFLNFHLKNNFRTNSIEIGINKEELHKGLMIRLSHLGFDYINSYQYNDNVIQCNFRYKGVKVFLYVLEDGKSFTSYDFSSNQINIYPMLEIKFKTYSYQGKEFQAPKDESKYFKNYFGKNWQFPDLSNNLFYGPNINVGERQVRLANLLVLSKKK